MTDLTNDMIIAVGKAILPYLPSDISSEALGAMAHDATMVLRRATGVEVPQHVKLAESIGREAELHHHLYLTKVELAKVTSEWDAEGTRANDLQAEVEKLEGALSRSESDNLNLSKEVQTLRETMINSLDQLLKQDERIDELEAEVKRLRVWFKQYALGANAEDELDLLRQIADERPWTQEERKRFYDISDAQEAAALSERPHD